MSVFQGRMIVLVLTLLSFMFVLALGTAWRVVSELLTYRRRRLRCHTPSRGV